MLIVKSIYPQIIKVVVMLLQKLKLLLLRLSKKIFTPQTNKVLLMLRQEMPTLCVVHLTENVIVLALITCMVNWAMAQYELAGHLDSTCDSK